MNKINSIIQKTLLLIVFLQLNIQSDPLAHFHKDNWDFLRYKFIIGPERKLKDLGPFLRRSFFSLLSASLSIRLGNFFSRAASEQLFKIPRDALNNNYISNASIRKLIDPGIGVSTTVLGAYFAHKFIKENQLLKYQQASLIDFISNWQENQNNCPEELKPVFNHIDSQYINNKKAFEAELPDTIRALVYSINNHFNINQAQEEPFSLRDFFQFKSFSSNISAELGSVLNGIANIIKSFKQ